MKTGISETTGITFIPAAAYIGNFIVQHGTIHGISSGYWLALLGGTITFGLRAFQKYKEKKGNVL